MTAHPQPYDVIVIGGGLAGTATAYYLAAGGLRTLLLERRRDFNTQASGSNAGSLHAQIPFEPFALEGDDWAEGFAPLVGFLAEAIALWRTLPDLLGVDLEVQTKGGIMAAATEDQMRALERKAALERRHGLEVELLGRDDLRRLAPYLSDRLIGGVYCPLEGKANPLLATPAFAAAAQRLGAELLRQTEVLGITREDGCAGEYTVTTTGGHFRAPRIVNAAGADAGRIAAMVGLKLAVQGFPIQVSVTEPVEPLIPHLVYYTGEKLSLKQTAAGTLLIGGGWPARLDAAGRPVVDPDSLANNLAIALEVVPSLASVNVVRTWAAIVNGTDDWKPILGEAPGAPGFYMNFFPWLGFTAGPLAAKRVAGMVQADLEGRAFLRDQVI